MGENEAKKIDSAATQQKLTIFSDCRPPPLGLLGSCKLPPNNLCPFSGVDVVN